MVRSELWLELCWETDVTSRRCVLRVSEACLAGITRKRRAPEAHGERTSHADSGVSLAGRRERMGMCHCPAAWPMSCLSFLSRKEQKKNFVGEE